MDIALITILFVSLLFIAFGLIILAGKGDMLISGYNTASPEKKAQYDVKRLRRVTATLLFVIAIILPLHQLYISTLDESQLAVASVVLTAVIVAISIIGVISMNTYCKKK